MSQNFPQSDYQNKFGIKFLLISNFALFILTKLPGIKSNMPEFMLEPLTFKVWQNLTYMFLHTDGFHFFFNMLTLFFIGRSVEDAMGTKKFLQFYVLCGVGGAIATHLIGLFGVGGVTLGASGAIFGLFYACYYYNPEAIVHVYFIFPVKLKWVLLVLGGFNLLMLFDENSGVAYYAHLGGLLTGILYFQLRVRVTQWLKNRSHKKHIKEVKANEDMKIKVDELLQKISREGMGALTSKEKKYLEKSSKKYHSKK